MNLTQDDLDAVAVAYRLGFMADQSETNAEAMVLAALQQRQPQLMEDELTALATEAVLRLKEQRGDWITGTEEAEEPA